MRGLRARRQDEERIDPEDLGARQLHPLGDAALDLDLAALVRAEQAVVQVAAGRVAGAALVAQEVAGADALAALDDDLLEVGVHAPVAVAVVDHDDDRERPPQLLGIEPLVVAGQVAEPADGVVEVAAGGEDDAVVGGHDPVATERGEVDAVVERLAVHDPGGIQRRGAEVLGEPAPGKRPAVARQAGDRRGAAGERQARVWDGRDGHDGELGRASERGLGRCHLDGARDRTDRGDRTGRLDGAGPDRADGHERDEAEHDGQDESGASRTVTAMGHRRYVSPGGAGRKPSRRPGRSRARSHARRENVCINSTLCATIPI